MKKMRLLKITAVLTSIVCITSCSTAAPPRTWENPHYPMAAVDQNMLAHLWEGNSQKIWDKLQHTSSSQLAAIEYSVSDPTQKAWAQLALINKQDSDNTTKLTKDLLTWRGRYPNHPANVLFPDNNTLSRLTSGAPPHQIAILLPESGPYKSSARTVREGFLNAYYANLSKTGKQNVKFYDTAHSNNIGALYQQAVADGADFIVGPLVRDNVQELKMGGFFKRPTVALNYTDIHFGSQPPNFYEFGLLPEDDAAQIADRAHRAGRSKAIIIAPRNAWGKRLAMSFSSKWQAMGGSVRHTWYFPPQANFSEEIPHMLDIDPNSSTPMTQQASNNFDVIFLFSQPKEARAIVPVLHQSYHDVPIYTTSAAYTSKSNATENTDLNNVIVCDIPWNMKKAKRNLLDETQSDRLYAVGQDAYLLSQSLSRLVLLPHFPIYGATGALTLSPTNQIHRRLPCSTVHNGYL